MDLLARMDPEVAVVFPNLPVLDLNDLPTARSTMMDMLAAANSGMPSSADVVHEDHLIPGLVEGDPEVRVRHYGPAGQSNTLPCLYWIHGGGHVLGQIEQDDPMMQHIVETVGCAAVSVNWRRPPEDPFPAPMNDCYAGLRWTYQNAAALRINPDRIAIGGASSGGGSAAGLALFARDRAEVPMCLQLLIYPMIDDRNVTPSSYAITEPKVWNRESNLIGWRSYLESAVGTDAVSPYAAPTRATNLEGLPPAFISVGDLDLFLDEDIEYAQRLLQAGVPTELHVYVGGIHGFDLLAPNSSLSRRFIRDRDDALRRALHG
jgi:acetyl esterase/lipase